MHLKKLKILGFKSFAKKVEMQFDPGITAVVGPNGSGKSNIADSIRWVLGEQSSKSLRSSKMEEVIFSGSGAKKQTNFAEVSIVLDNSDAILPLEYTEVTLTRKFFRDQESEYRINDVACRLKDIQDLMMDTGLGKGTYSIIGQGQVDQLLSNRPIDRRVIFEEAAGINKYKQRKELTLKKLDTVSVNLLRLNDIISEIESRVEPLENQAHKAQRYRELRREIDVLEKAVLFYDAQGLSEQMEIINERIKEAESEAFRIESEINSFELAIERLRNDQVNLDSDIQTVIQRRSEIKNDLDSIQRSRDYAKERATDLLSRIDDLEIEIKQSRLRIENNSRARAELEARRMELEQKLLEIESNCADKGKQVRQMELDLDRSRQKLDDMKARVLESVERLARFRNELTALEVNNSHKTDTRKKLLHERESLEAQGARLREETARITENLGQARTEAEDSGHELAKLNDRIQNGRASLEGSRQRLSDDKELLARVESELALLRRMEAELEGYGKGVKEAIKRHDSGDKAFAGILGDMAHAIHVSDPGVEESIEILLGDTLQYLFVLDSDSANNAADALRKDDMGRATFFPIQDIPPCPSTLADREKISALDGVECFLLDRVQSDERYKEPLKWILGHAVRVRDRNAARALWNKFKFMAPIVTAQGEVFLPPGILRSGSGLDSGPGLISRQRRIEELGVEEKRLTDAAARREDDIKREQESLARLEHARAEREKAAQETRHRVVELEMRLHSREEAAQNLQRDFLIIDDDIKTIENDLSELNIKISESGSQVEAVESEKAQKDRELAEMEAQLNSFSAQRDADKDALSRIQLESAAGRGELETCRSDLRRLDAEDKDLAIGIENKTEQIKTIKIRQAQYVEESQNADHNADSLHGTLESVDNELRDARDRKSKLDQQLREADVQLRQTRKNFMDHKEEVNDFKVKLSRFESKREETAQRLEELYGLTLEEVPKEVQLQKGAKGRLRELRLEIESLGSVNLLAIEEHRSVLERLKFLEMHRDDLLKSRDDLLAVIAEIDKVSTETFVDMFAKINAQFKEVFVQLFGGGEAELRLTDPNIPLESGIEIDIQLPGKAKQNLMLLSGGEKALSAIALLFAILKVKPTPFCILDEIDAPLDENNVRGFCGMLKKFGETTQFLIITHNKGTMEVADVLYGVTMEEEGISKVVSVKLSEAEKMAEQQTPKPQGAQN